MADDPAITSVRVAVALCDRFDELLKGPTSVSAAKQNNAMFGVSGNETELSLRIGEANQIYPEIWRHLDEARNSFAARGVTVAGYDTLRAAEGSGLGANVQTSYSQVAGRYGHERTTKDANFNRAGLVRARMGCNSLMQATPDINWAAIAKAEANDPAAAAFGRATRRKRYIMFGVLALVFASPFLYVMWQHHQDRVRRDEYRAQWEREQHPAVIPAPAPEPRLPDTPETAAFKKHLDEIRAAYDGAVASWATTMSPEALAAIKPGRADSPCSKQVQAPSSEAAQEYIEAGTADAAAFASSDFHGYVAADGPIPSDLIANTATALDRTADRVARSGPTAHDQEHLSDYPLDVTFVVIESDIEPKVTSTAPTVYTPGTVTGHGYVYSIQQGKVVCAAAIDAKNPPVKQMPAFVANAQRASDASGALHRQLEIAIRQELAAKLRAVAP